MEDNTNTRSEQIAMEEEKAAKKFAGKNINRKINNSRLRCSDGRTTNKEAEGGIRIFGADLGVLFAVSEALDKAGVDYTAKELVGRYLLTKKSPLILTEGAIENHTDSHAKHQEPEGVGCGHIRIFAEKNSKFSEIWSEVLKLPTEDRYEMELKGGHNEQGVLVVDSDRFTIDSNDQESQYFVFDQKRARNFINKITPALGFGNSLSPDSVWEAYLRQMAETAKILAKGKPQFRVFEEDGNVEIQSLGKVA